MVPAGEKSGLAPAAASGSGGDARRPKAADAPSIVDRRTRGVRRPSGLASDDAGDIEVVILPGRDGGGCRRFVETGSDGCGVDDESVIAAGSVSEQRVVNHICVAQRGQIAVLRVAHAVGDLGGVNEAQRTKGAGVMRGLTRIHEMRDGNRGEGADDGDHNQEFDE